MPGPNGAPERGAAFAGWNGHPAGCTPGIKCARWPCRIGTPFYRKRPRLQFQDMSRNAPAACWILASGEARRVGRMNSICLKELEFAASLNKRFAPIVYRRVSARTVPEALRRLQFIFFEDEAYFDETVATLDQALPTDIAWIRKHTEFGELSRRLGQGRTTWTERAAAAFTRS